MKLPLIGVRREPSDPEQGRSTIGPAMLPDSVPALDGLRVLVVDDEADTRELLTIILEHCGAEVTAVASTAEALAALDRSRPDVLVSDIGMSGEDGYDLIRKVRAQEPESKGRIPAVALTAYDSSPP